MALSRDTTNVSVMLIRDGSDRYEIVATDGQHWLHSETITGGRKRKLLPEGAVEGLLILWKKDCRHYVLSLMKAIVPE